MLGADRQLKRLLPAIGLGFLAPMAIAPFALIIMFSLRFFRPLDQFGGFLGEACYNLFNALIPESGYKGLLLPFLIVGFPFIFVGDLVAAVLAWRVLRSKKLAAVTLATSLSAQLSFIAAACVFLKLIW